MTLAKYLSDYCPPQFTIDHVSLTFELDPKATQVTSVLQVRRLDEKATALILDGEQLQLKGVYLNGKQLMEEAYQLSATQLTIHAMPAQAELRIDTEINPEANTSLEGLYLSAGAFCTQCEAEGFRKITYYLDRPDVLACFTTTVIGHEQNYPYLLSNGNLESKHSLADGRVAVTWKDPHPKPCYLFALVAGDFDVLDDRFVTQSGRDVALRLFVDKGNLDRAQHAMASLKAAMKWDEQIYGLEYDLDIYMVVAVDFFNMGAMENKGLNVFNSKYVLANHKTATDSDFNGIESVIGHEYFHNWTGNRVTCRDWFQLSLKEGLTVFRDQCFSQDMTQSSVNRIDDVAVMRTHQFTEDSGPMAHPIRPLSVIEMNNFYTVTVYNKGAEVIRMMHTLLGKSGFRKGMDLYFKRHDGQAVTCDDFVQAMEDANHFDLSLFKTWYQQAGTPSVFVKSEYKTASRQFVVQLKQVVPPTSDCQIKQHTLIPLRISLYSQDGRRLPLVTRTPLTDSNVYSFASPTAELVFEGLDEEPTPAFLDDFSAPIKLIYDYSDEALLTLLTHSLDGFTRWDASQQLLARSIKRAMDEPLLPIPSAILNGYRSVAQSEVIEPALKSRLLMLPAVADLINQHPKLAIHQLLDAIQHVEQQLARALRDDVLKHYQQNEQADYLLSADAMGKRALRTSCLNWIAIAEPSLANDLCLKQYQDANNMTDTLAALQVANKHSLPVRQELMNDFYQAWHQDGLVMDKWLQLQGSWDHPDCMENLQRVLEDPVFSLKNPNRTRALLSGFYAMNPRQFHAKDGRGYGWLADKIEQLNGINPQVAARMISPLTQWQRFEKAQGDLMKAELKQLRDMPSLSPDLEEIIDKSLNQADV